MKIKVIYKITNTINGKVYIGQTVNTSKRWSQHKKEAKKEIPSMVVNKAMKKYGIENFTFDVLCSIRPVQDEQEYCQITDEYEEYFINEYDSMIQNGKGYNVCKGGPTSPKTEEWKKQNSERMKQYIQDHPEWFKDKFQAAAYTPEVIAKRVETFMQNNPEQFLKFQEAGHDAIRGTESWNKGLETPEETRKKQSEARFQLMANGFQMYNKGTKGVMKPNQTSFKKGQTSPRKGTTLNKKCCINNCEKKHLAKGLCSFHYHQQYKKLGPKVPQALHKG